MGSSIIIGESSSKVLEKNHEYEVLESSNKKLIADAAECLADTFIGVQVGNSFIKEPMANAINISKEDFLIFVEEYIKNVVEQGLCFVAKDKQTKRVVGALACEVFNPNEEPPIFGDELEPMNKIIDFLGELDLRFIEAFNSKMNREMRDDELTHGFMIGVRADNSKKQIAAELVRLWIEKSKELGYKGVFVEATNFRSQRLVIDLFHYYTPLDITGKPITSIYADNETFSTITSDIATECMILYKYLDPEYKL